MPIYTNQESRLLAVSTPLGEDVLLLTGFSGREELSRPFTYELEFLSEEEAIAPKDIVGKAITWSVNHQDKEPRHFHGIVRRFVAGALHLHGLRTYRAEVVPWLWFLTRTTNCRIFQNKTSPQIIEILFKEYGFKDYEPALKRSYPPWEYCVQYRESAFAFISRLMEHEGIFYYFRHEEDKHTLVLADHKGAYKDCVENQVEYSAGSLAPNHIDTWEHQCEFRTGRWAHTDYNFETPSTNLLTSTNTLMKLPGVGKFEVFDYPGDYRVKGEGEADVKVRMEEEEAGHDVVVGAGNCCTFTPGGKFTLQSHDTASEAGKSYVLTSVEHMATDASYGQNGEVSTYRNRFTCIPDTVTFRPARVTPQPVVHGPQTAVVVGPTSEKIFCDKYGRIKVQFHWDRLGKMNEESSCWVRVSQNWGGANWGGMFIPHVGQEVIVEFEEGDPDRPLVTGRVYNAEIMPPLELPANKTKSAIRDHGGNEIIMEGHGGVQQIRLFSPHSNTVMTMGAPGSPPGWNTATEMFITFLAGKDWNVDIGKNHNENIKGYKKQSIALFRHTFVGLVDHQTVGGAKINEVGGFRAEVVALYKKEIVRGRKNVVIGSNLTETVRGKHTMTVKKDASLTVTEGYEVSAKTVEINGEEMIVLEDGKEISLLCGKSSINMKSDGTITIKAKKVEIDATEDAIVRSGSDVFIDGPKVRIEGDKGNILTSGLLKINGTPVKINCAG